MKVNYEKIVIYYKFEFRKVSYEKVDCKKAFVEKVDHEKVEKDDHERTILIMGVMRKVEGGPE